MEKSKLSHWLIVASVVAAVVIVLVGMANWMLTRIVKQRLDTNIAMTDSMLFSYDDVHIEIISGKVWITDVLYQSDTLAYPGDLRTMTRAESPWISLDGVNYFDWLVRRRVVLRGVTVKSPRVRVLYNSHSEELADINGQDLADKIAEERIDRRKQMIDILRPFVDEAVIQRVSVEDALVQSAALDDSLSVVVQQATVHLYDIGYSLKDSMLLYNNHMVHMDVKDVDVRLPKADTHLHVDEFAVNKKGTVTIQNATVSANWDDEQSAIQAGIKEIVLDGVNVALFEKTKQLQVSSIHLYNPYSRMWMNEDASSSSSYSSKPIQSSQMDTQIEAIKMFITGVTIDTLQLHQGNLDYQSTSSALQTHAKGVSLALYGIGYSLIDEIPYHYNDSVYQFGIDSASIRTPDDLIQINTSGICYEDGGAFQIGETHIYHTVDKWALAHLLGDEPATWMDMTIRNVRTSSKNIVKDVFTLKEGFYLDTIMVDVAKMNVFRDNRYKPKHANSMPQSALLGLKYPFVLHRLYTRLGAIHMEVAMSDKSVGKLDLGKMNIQMRNVTAKRNSTISVVADGRMGSGIVNATMALTVNPACNWNMHLHAKDLDLSCMNSFIYPLVGMKFGCDIHSLETTYGGDSHVANGTFCMLYDNMTVHADKESDTPYKIIGNMSGLINSAGKTLITHSNPTRPGQTPRSYQVTWKNDPWKNISLFFIGPLVNGCIETLLPGMFVHRQVKDKTNTSML